MSRVSLQNRKPFFDLSVRRITKEAEDNMEYVSAMVTDGAEMYLDHWKEGTYHCARCHRALYSSEDKWNGPCAWPSFRKAVTERGEVMIATDDCKEYNQYTCTVMEVYCGGCNLFIGHQFEDAREKGDASAACTGWRH